MKKEVTENKEQFVNIREPHGFNIGAAGQPPHIKNSLHSHFTAEVFMRKNSVRIFATDEASLISAYSKELGCPVEEGDDWRGDHAGKWETSILMALYPDLVDISLLPKNKDAELIGIIGEDPRRSTLEFGKRAIKLILNEMVEKGKQLVKEAETG